ncbi:MAG: phosphate acyltransferase PlsX [Streptococcaceae bacterium]|jgi:glycerol-3-phosphate acyltransferase PlsX|nr:phosphate acyltransferase PlsX [Streptococcaceae bacterium]
MTYKLAIDAMGGDNAPRSIIDGIKMSLEMQANLEFHVYGDVAQLTELENLPQVVLHATSEIIDFHDEPVKAIRKKKDSSMVRALKAVKDGEADAVLSAGNTGAFLAGGMFIVGRLRKIERPALMSTLPTADGAGFDMLDLGANAENKAEHLRDYAILGSFYAEKVRGVKNPRVALLSNGAEESKGSQMILDAHKLLSALTEINFIGNIESRDILTGAADVVVADGFTGNAVLKAIEGTASVLMHQIKDGILNGSVLTKLGGALVKGELGKLRTAMSTDSAGGALLAGVKAPVVKAHGNSSPEAIAASIQQIHKILESRMVAALTEAFDHE